MKKLFSLLLSVVLLLGATSCDWLGRYEDGDKGGADYSSYDGIVAQYTSLLSSKVNGFTLAEGDETNKISDALLSVVNVISDPSVMGHAQKDLNGDGVKELILLSNDFRIYTIFTMKDGAPVLLLNAPRNGVWVRRDGLIYYKEYRKDEVDVRYLQRIENGKLVGIEWGWKMVGEKEVAYKIENGTYAELSSEEYNSYYQYTDSLVNTTLPPQWENEKIGLRFIAAFADSVIKAPSVDFSSYDGILSAYRAIVDRLSDFTSGKITNAEYMSIFTFDSDEEFDTFFHIFYRVQAVLPMRLGSYSELADDFENTYGYARRDLDGDGTEELILLSDRYEVISVFTERDGKAVEIDLFGRKPFPHNIYIDDEGRIHTVYMPYDMYEVEWACYTLSGGALTALATGYERDVSGVCHFYKVENGVKAAISEEESNALVKTVDNAPSYVCDAEYTRMSIGASFLPICEHAEASDAHLATLSNSAFVNGSTVTVSAITATGVSFSFHSVYTVGEWAPPIEPEVYEVILEGEAVREGERYYFEIDGVSGYLEFAVSAVWVVVTDSANESVPVRANLFNHKSPW